MRRLLVWTVRSEFERRAAAIAAELGQCSAGDASAGDRDGAGAAGRPAWPSSGLLALPRFGEDAARLASQGPAAAGAAAAAAEELVQFWREELDAAEDALRRRRQELLRRRRLEEGAGGLAAPLQPPLKAASCY